MARTKGTKNITDADHLWRLFQAYMRFNEKNPMYENVVIPKDGDYIRVPRVKPLTRFGFSIYLSKRGIIQDIDDYFDNTGGAYDDYSGIVTRIKRIIYQDKFAGAAVGMFNASIIARDLGLKDHKVSEIDDKRKSIEELFPPMPKKKRGKANKQKS